MNILITGTSGFIGGYLRQYFLNHNHHVIGTVNSREPRENEIRVDLTKRENLAKMPSDSFDVVIHTVGMLEMTANRETMYRVNLEATKNVLSWAKQTGCKHFIQTSSVSIYGMKILGENRTENTTKRYTGRFWLPYGTSKAQAEQSIENSGIPYTILRLPQTLGPNDYYITGTLIGGLLQGVIPKVGTNDHMISLLYVKNLGPILEKVIQSGPTNDYFNCTDYDIHWSEFIGEFARLLNVDVRFKPGSKMGMFSGKAAPYKYLIMNSAYGAQYPSDKLHARIPYSPEFPWQQAVKEMVDYYVQRHPNYRTDLLNTPLW